MAATAIMMKVLIFSLFVVGLVEPYEIPVETG